MSAFALFHLPDGPVVESLPGEADAHVDSLGTALIEACLSAGGDRALLHAAHLPPAFFDLSSRQAGELLQRLRNYQIRLAVLLPSAGVATSSRFGEMVEEAERGRDFGVFTDRVTAEAWLETGPAASATAESR